MTEPMKKAERKNVEGQELRDILKELNTQIAIDYFPERSALEGVATQTIANAMQRYAAQQVTQERERIKNLLSAKFLDRDWSVVERHRSISYLDLKELIDSL